MTCFCKQCCDNPKPTYTENYRMECLARFYAKEIAILQEPARIERYLFYKNRYGKEFQLMLVDETNKRRREVREAKAINSNNRRKANAA